MEGPEQEDAPAAEWIWSREMPELALASLPKCPEGQKQGPHIPLVQCG